MKRVNDETLEKEILALEKLELKGRIPFDRIVVKYFRTVSYDMGWFGYEKRREAWLEREVFKLEDLRKPPKPHYVCNDKGDLLFDNYTIMSIRDDMIYLISCGHGATVPAVWVADGNRVNTSWGQCVDEATETVMTISTYLSDGPLNEESALDLERFEVRGEQSFDTIVVEEGFTRPYTPISGGLHGDREFELDKIKGMSTVEFNPTWGYSMPDKVKILAIDNDTIYLYCDRKYSRIVYKMQANDRLTVTGPKFTDTTAAGIRVYTKKNGKNLYTSDVNKYLLNTVTE